MKHIIIIILLFLSHCQSVTNYLQYRAYDFRDMFTIGVEKNVAGGSFFVWCFGGGLQYGSKGEGYGIRGTHLGKYKTGYNGEIPPNRSFSTRRGGSETHKNSIGYVSFYGTSFILENSIEQVNTFSENLRAKNKSYSAVNSFLIPTSSFLSTDYSSSECEKDPEFCLLSKLGRKCEMPLQFEVSLGLYYGLRLGLNFYEALDFITGIFGVDILDDDTLAPMTEKDRREMLSEIHYEIQGTRLAWIGESCSKDRVCIEGLCVEGKCLEKKKENTNSWTGQFCSIHTPCREGVCLDGVCMAKEMEALHPNKKKTVGCFRQGSSCTFDIECSECGVCKNNQCIWR